MLDKDLEDMWEHLIRQEHEDIFGTVDKTPTEDKIFLSLEEPSSVSELTPGQIAHIVKENLRDLPASLDKDLYESFEKTAIKIAYEIMSKTIDNN